MEITKDIENYFQSNFLDFKQKLSVCSQDETGNAMVSNSPEAFNFDKISKLLFPNEIASIDCVFFKKQYMDFIEFKGGLIDKINKNYQSQNYPCDKCNELHKDGYKLLLEKQEGLKKIIHQNIQLKIVESLYLLVNSILPYCTALQPNYKLRFILVFKAGEIDPLDEFEMGTEDLAKNSKSELRKLLRKYACCDNQGNKIFFETIDIYTDKEFSNLKRYQ